MAINQERAELHKTIWNMACETRGSIEEWNFKSYVLGTIFYRYISENITNYVNKIQREAGLLDFDYAKCNDVEVDTEDVRKQLIKEKGYFILPSQLFCNVCANAEMDENLNETLNGVFESIEHSALNEASYENVKGLFSDYAVNSPQLGGSVIARNKNIAKVLKSVGKMQLGSRYDELESDPFGDAYEYLMQMYAGNAGKVGGEFFTPQEVSKLLVRLCQWENPNIHKVYDPACGSGSLLLRFARMDGAENRDLEYFGQEINLTTYNLCRSNMFLHDINYDHFHIALGDTLLNPQWGEASPFDAIVSNPPYSVHWEGKENPLLINDERFAPAGVLAPTSKADLAFVMHILYNLSETGTAAIVEFPGVLYRGGTEQKIRKYLVDNNYVDTVIQLPANLFFGVTIATCIIVLKKNKRENKTLFIDASEQFIHVGNRNRLSAENIDAIVEAYAKRDSVQYFTKMVDNDVVAKNDYNMSVSSYVEERETKSPTDIKALTADLKNLVERNDVLRKEIAEIVKEIVGKEVE